MVDIVGAEIMSKLGHEVLEPHLKLAKQVQHGTVVHQVLEGAGSWDLIVWISSTTGSHCLRMLLQLQQGKRRHTVQPCMQSLEGCALREQHQQPIHAPATRSIPALPGKDKGHARQV